MKNGLSIIVPIYNTPKELLIECLLHLEKLNFSFECEFILVNDGSTLPIEHIITEFKNRDLRFNYFEKKNSGVSAARNTGIKMAKFSKCLFLDPDDYIYQDDYKLQLSDDVDLYFFPFRKLTQEELLPQEKVIDVIDVISSENLIKSQLHLDEEIYQGINCFFASTCWGKIYSTNYLKEGILFDSEITKREDVIFTLEYYQKCEKVSIISSLTYVYRINRLDSLSYRFDSSLWNNYQKVFIKLRKLLNQNYDQDLLLYSFNLFHEGLSLDLLNDKSNRSIKNKLKKMKNFKSLINNEISLDKLPSLSLLPAQKKILYWMISKNKMFTIIVLTKLKNKVGKLS